MEKPTPAPGTITLTITHPEKERYELCEISCGAATTLEDLKEQICAKTGLQARILVMAKRYEADDDARGPQGTNLREDGAPGAHFSDGEALRSGRRRSRTSRNKSARRRGSRRAF